MRPRLSGATAWIGPSSSCRMAFRLTPTFGQCDRTRCMRTARGCGTDRCSCSSADWIRGRRDWTCWSTHSRSAGLREAALVLVGPDCRGSRRALATLAERLGISSQLVFIEPAFGQDRANLFAAADVFVHPSRWEGLSLSVLAAAAAGKPCLITREADPLGELERAQAAVVVEASVSSIAEGLRRAATLSRDELQTMGARARRVAEAHFTWPSIAGTLVEPTEARSRRSGAQITRNTRVCFDLDDRSIRYSALEILARRSSSQVAEHGPATNRQGRMPPGFLARAWRSVPSVKNLEVEKGSIRTPER